MTETWDLSALELRNIAQGKCPRCGGTGLVADLRALARRADPHASRACQHCRGTGKPTAHDRERLRREKEERP